MNNTYDVIVIGAGSVGIPIALALGEKGIKTLVLDRNPSPGQGENKHAIGGIRATHSDPAKIRTCLRSIDIFTHWEDRFGDDIEWLKGGYTYPVYRNSDAALLKGMLPVQKQHGLKIDFVSPLHIREIVPGINPDGLIGGTYSPDDGSASPLLSVAAFYRRACRLGVQFRFKEAVNKIICQDDTVRGVETGHGRYAASVVVDAAGAYSRSLCQSVGIDMPVFPDSHEAGISEPVQPFFTTMVVDIRPAPGSKNYYFYQNRLGQVIFCLTPDPLVPGTDTRETSAFLPMVSARMVDLLPRLKNLRVRRVWRGLYPMSPDGSPLVGWNREKAGLMHATGMCGQGFMLGPGLGEVIARLIAGESSEADQVVLSGFSLYRSFEAQEKLK
jgi:sarcosine oxidase subunit beta